MAAQKEIQNTDQLMELGRDYLVRATDYLSHEAKARPYAILAGAFSVGYLFGQGWFRAVSRLGFAYLAQQAGAAMTAPKKTQRTIH